MSENQGGFWLCQSKGLVGNPIRYGGDHMVGSEILALSSVQWVLLIVGW